MVKDGKAEGGFTDWGANRAKERGWRIFTFEGEHASMRDQPEEFVKKLEMVLK